MRKVVGIWVVAILFAMITVAKAEAGGTNYNSYKSAKTKHFHSLMMKRPAVMAYRALLRAANTIPIAKAFAKSVENGDVIFSGSEKYYKEAKQAYENREYRKSIQYAMASLCLSKAIVSAYKAENQVQLPPPPQMKKFNKNRAARNKLRTNNEKGAKRKKL